MATETVQASGTTTPNNWTLGAGASKQAAVNAPDDDDTSYVNSGTTINTVQTFTCSPSSIQVGDTITQIDINIRYIRDHISNVTFVVGYSFTPNGGGTQTNESTAFTATTSYQSSTYSDTGLSVVWGSGLTIYAKNTQARNLRISTLEIVLTYTPGGGGSSQTTRSMHQFRQRRV
jgi:hypothetical protein